MKQANKEPEIKLFGMKIALPENGVLLPVMVYSGGCGGNDENSCGSGPDQSDKEREEEEGEEKSEEEQESNEDCLAGEVCETGPGERDQSLDAEESKNTNAVSELDHKPEAIPVDEVCTTLETSENENNQNNATNSQQKTLKKPDKILPCPRCNSMDTKFCYYNNYNVNQPRHFCKSCQRYWTAGGTMRNVPVGAGRRKNKNSTSNCRHITISEALQAAQIDAPNGYHHPAFKPNGTVLSFGPEVPLREPMASVLELAEKKPHNGFRNGYYKSEQGTPIPHKGVENGDDCSSGSSITTSTSVADGGDNRPQKPVMQNVNGSPFPIPCLPGVPWPFPWGPAVHMPAICPSGFPMQFYTGPYWNCTLPGPWSIPWLSSAANQKASGPSPNSPTLGKHSRDGELLRPSTPEPKQSSEQKKAEGSVLVPKTLRIDDPDEAAKSSIWTTLGIKYDAVNKRGIFNAFQPKYEEKKQVAKTSPLLQANPAALSRSLNFQETA